MMPTLMELAQAGAHFGHHRSLVYPKAKRFIYTIKNSVALINLEQTQARLAEAQKVLVDHLAAGKSVLFVGTKKSQRQITKQIAESIKAPYINDRWLGGFLTNFSSFLANIKRTRELEEHLASEASKSLSKAERLRLGARLARSQRFLEGVRQLDELPQLLVLASASQDRVALKEALQVGIPVIAITDTDINPEQVTYPIPANDDAPRAVELILRSLVEPASKLKPRTDSVSRRSKPTATKTVKEVTRKATESKKRKASNAR